MRRRHHDMEFAKSVNEMSDEEWERVGDDFEKQFNDWDGDQTCHFYTGRARKFKEPQYVVIAWSVTDEEGRVLIEQSRYLGVGVAKPIGHYTALLEGLAVVVAAGMKKIQVYCGSRMVSSQVVGQRKATKPEHAMLLEQVLEQTEQLKHFSIEFVPRNKNGHAANLAHEAIRKHIELVLQEKDASSPDSQTSPSGAKQNMEECPICLEKVRETESFKLKACSHRFCLRCFTQHVEIRVKSNQVPVQCPGDCSNSIDIDECRNFLSPELVESYERRQIEASIPESERVYCPFPDCSSLMSKGDEVPSAEASTSRHSIVIWNSECMECHRLFCAECRVPWHADMSCEEYQRLPAGEREAEDINFHRLASNSKWQRCKECRCMIELDQGCYHMTCRCGHEFCYICGAPWVSKQATCKCNLWDEANIVRGQ